MSKSLESKITRRKKPRISRATSRFSGKIGLYRAKTNGDGLGAAVTDDAPYSRLADYEMISSADDVTDCSGS